MTVRLHRSPSLAVTDYSYAASVPASARMVHLAGACPLDPEGTTIAPGDYEAQAHAVVANLRQALADLGADLTDLVSHRVLVASSNQADLVRVWDVVRAAFGDHDVPSTLLGVTVLGYPGQVVEVEAVAVLPEPPAPPDGVFDDARLAAVYDPLDPDRSDLDHYLTIAEELGARSVLDVGCGTGSFATMLAARGCDVVGVDPAGASLTVARGKPHADRVRWVHGDAAAAVREIPGRGVDLAVMTGNVAQVFVADEAWEANLRAIASLLRPGGYLVFETRIPAARAWEGWNAQDSFTAAEVPGIGRVESWHELLDVRGETVTFRSHTRFPDGVTIPAESTLRFRSQEQVTASLARCGFLVREVRDAPDRPGKEHVVLAQRVE